MHDALATADPVMEDLPLVAGTLANLYETLHQYVRTLEARHRIPDGLPPRVKAARDALNALADAETPDRQMIRDALAPSAALIADLPRHNPAADLDESEKTHAAAHRDRGREVVGPLAETLQPHVPAGVDARLVATRVAETHPHPFVALRVARDLSAGMTSGVTFKGLLQRLANAKTAAQRKAGLAAERETAIELLRALGRAEQPSGYLPVVEKPAAPPRWPQDPYVAAVYAIDSEEYWREVTRYRKEFFADLRELTEFLGDREAVKSALTDRWTRTITPTLVDAFVDEVGGRLIHAEVTAQQLAGVHLRMVHPKTARGHEPGVAFGRLADEILAAHDSVVGLKDRAADLAAMSFDVLGEAALDTELDKLTQSVRWKAPALGGQVLNPDTSVAESPLAHASEGLLKNFDWTDGKVVDPYRLGRYFGYVVAARHRPLPTEGEAAAGELWRRVDFARDGANIMLHAGRLHPEAVTEVTRRVQVLIDDMETLTLARSQDPNGSRDIVHRSWDSVRRQLERLDDPEVDPTSSEWRRRFEERVDRAINSHWRKPRQPTPGRGRVNTRTRPGAVAASRADSASTNRRQPPAK